MAIAKSKLSQKLKHRNLNYVDFERIPGSKMIHLSDLILGTLSVLIFFLLLYWICERIGIVPIIGLRDPSSHFVRYVDVGEYSKTYAELIIGLILILEIGFVLGWILWFKIRGYSIIW